MPKFTCTFSVSIYIPKKLCDIWLKIKLIYRELRYGHTYRKIPLTQGRFALVDAEDYEWAVKYKWHLRGGENITNNYAVRCVGTAGINRKYINMHRQIMMFKLNPDLYTDAEESSKLDTLPADIFVDHIDGDGLNNTKSNLRIATPAQNSRNKAKRKNSKTSKYKGVAKSRYSDKWIARICHNYERIHLGCFDTEKEAALAYDKAARKYHKEFANLNFPKK